MYTNILLLIVFISCFASLMNGGLWSNTLTLVNVITAALLATNYFEPLADWFEQRDASFTYVWDFLALWLIFIIAMLLLRIATDYMSDIKVRFYVPLERAGGYIMAVWASWIVVCFTTMTLHTAPLARNFLGQSFQPTPQDRMLFGLAPDRRWLAWVHRESKGSLCRLHEIAEFDPQGDFILRYGKRREAFEGQLSLTTPKSGAGAPPDLPAGLVIPDQ